LGAILEAKSGRDLRTLFHEQVLRPLGMPHSFYSPVDNPEESVAPTEDNAWHGRLLQGEVHDENASVLGGVAGHAGVFTCLRDCHMLARELIKATQGESSWLRRETVGRFISRELSWALGWDRPSRPVSQAGSYFPEMAVGHLGFTGCSMWIDLEREIVAILLTNRVHPRRDNERIKEFRPKLHDSLFQHYIR
jgi:CubicO group peptidase (beta-lactamase class C family)